MIFSPPRECGGASAMNYRHQFHAGNFADVMKHALLVQLTRALQKKDKGFLILDTHAGRGSYDLAVAAKGDTLAREPEWPAGIGRLWSATTLSPVLEEYVQLVRQFDHDRGNRDALPRFYPGSPWVARLRSRLQDQLALCEKHPEEFAVLAAEFATAPNGSVHEMDGYVAVRAMLPPRDRRALVLIDPPYEAQDEFAQIVTALQDGLARLAGGVFAVWYPLTERARVDVFEAELVASRPPPTVALELTVAGPESALKMRGCGLVVVNPPWQFEKIAGPLLAELAGLLAQGRRAGVSVRWLVPEK